MKSLFEFGFMLMCAAIASLIITPLSTNAQSISSQMDELNAGIRARAAAQKGRPPEQIRVWSSGTTEDRVRAETKKSGKCAFSYYVFGDEKGKVLANEAKDECYRNEELKARGQGDQISREADEQWKDHRQMTKRERAPIRSKQSHCTPDFFGGLNCQSY